MGGWVKVEIKAISAQPTEIGVGLSWAELGNIVIAITPTHTICVQHECIERFKLAEKKPPTGNKSDKLDIITIRIPENFPFFLIQACPPMPTLLWYPRTYQTKLLELSAANSKPYCIRSSNAE